MFVPLSTVDELRAAAARQGLEVTPIGDALDGMGLDFLVLHGRDAAGVRWVVRSPRRADVVQATEREGRVLAHVQKTLPIAVPDWRVHAPDVIAYPRLDGVPAVTMDGGTPTWNRIDPAAPSAAFVDGMAELLVALQAVPPAEAGLPVGTIADERASLAKTLDATRATLDPPAKMWDRWQRWLAADAMWPSHVALVHGDLHPGHLLLDETGRLVGVLDWTEARAADPAVDFAMFHFCFGRAALEALVERFEARGGRTWPAMVEHAIERAAVGPALGAEWAMRTGNAMVLDLAKSQLAALLQGENASG
jgi:aminoglycoside phosphotransferase (APT) family kinase protein